MGNNEIILDMTPPDMRKSDMDKKTSGQIVYEHYHNDIAWKFLTQRCQAMREQYSKGHWVEIANR